MSRYHVSNSEGLHEKNSDEQVLANKLGISDANKINDAELVLLEQLYDFIFEEQFPLGQITVSMLKKWHHRWLGNIYEWAGRERTVNISKGGFMFAPSAQRPKLLDKFDTNYLARYTPCDEMDEELLIEAISVIHVELILIHPFREGNGRLSRLLADVMAVQGGFKPLNYRSWEQNRAQYISTIHAGISMDYEPMKHWVKKALKNG